MSKYLIGRDLSKKVLTVGVYYRHCAPGGMASVLASYAKHIEGMRTLATWRLGPWWVRGWYMTQALTSATMQLSLDPRLKIVHIHTAAHGSFLRASMVIKIAKTLGKKVVLHVHASKFIKFYEASQRKPWIVETLNKCDRLIVLSHSWEEFFQKIGVEKDKIVILNNIVDLPDSQPTREYSAPLRVLYMGEISQRKGYRDLLKAIADEQDYFRGRLQLRLGGNELDGDIRAMIKELGIGDMVSFDGWLAGEKKTEALQWEDVYILPSYNEGLPIAILEAMAYSHPVISTPVGGIPEVVKPGETGMLVEPGDTKAIAAALRHYIDHSHDIQAHGARGRELVNDYLPEKVMSRLSQIYRSLL